MRLKVSSAGRVLDDQTPLPCNTLHLHTIFLMWEGVILSNQRYRTPTTQPSRDAPRSPNISNRPVLFSLSLACSLSTICITEIIETMAMTLSISCHQVVFSMSWKKPLVFGILTSEEPF